MLWLSPLVTNISQRGASKLPRSGAGTPACSVSTFLISTLTLPWLQVQRTSLSLKENRVLCVCLKLYEGSEWVCVHMSAFLCVWAWERQTHLPHPQSVAYICGTLSSTWCGSRENRVCASVCLSQLSWLHSRRAQSYTAAGLQWPLFWRSSSFVLLMSIIHGVKSTLLCQWVSLCFLTFLLSLSFTLHPHFFLGSSCSINFLGRRFKCFRFFLFLFASASPSPVFSCLLCLLFFTF